MATKRFTYLYGNLAVKAPTTVDIALINSIIYDGAAHPADILSIILPNQGIFSVPANVIMLEILTPGAWFFPVGSLGNHTKETLTGIDPIILMDVREVAQYSVYSYRANSVALKGYFTL